MTEDSSIPDAADDAEWEALARYLDGELPPDEAEAVRAWIAADPARQALVGLVEPAAPVEVDTPVDVEAALARVASRIDAPTVLPFRRLAPSTGRHRGTGWRVAAAAAAVLAVGGTVWQASRGPSGGEAHAYATAAGQRDSLMLPDGTRVLLGPSSRVEVEARYGRGARDVTLTGEAFFRVEHDAARPFTVRAGPLTVRDVGTSFVVRYDPGAVEVAVTEGVVDASANGSTVRLARGDRGSLSAAGALTVARAAVADADVAWTRGQLLFVDASFDRVRADLRRWYGLEVAASPALAARHVTATFDGDTPAHVLEVLGMALGADVVRRGDTAVFTPR